MVITYYIKHLEKVGKGWYMDIHSTILQCYNFCVFINLNLFQNENKVEQEKKLRVPLIEKLKLMVKIAILN